MKSWVTPFNVWCQSRGSGKTTMGAPFIMSKSNLFPNMQIYILSGVGSQAQETFMKIEKIAKREISSFTGLTDVFYNETVKSVANTDGFTHNPASFQYKLYNGSVVNSLNGAFDNNRSKRSNLNFYDEAGFAPDELFETSMPFITQDSNFKLGGDIDLDTLPKQIPNQAIFASSASSTDTYFYRVYKDYSKKMIIGDKRYFVADINAEIVLNPTVHGKPYPVPLLRQEVIDDAMKKNKEKALREYYNKFSTEGGDNQAIKRATIIRNSEVRPPILYNNHGGLFAIAYDPARSYDNSVCMVGEIYYDEQVGYKMRICNGVSFVDVAKKKKTPMRTPEQVAAVKQMLLDYNGLGFADYENISALLIDSGAGGAGVNIADYFMEDWKDNKGQNHRGLIDKIESVDYVNKFPNAIDKIKLVNPKKYRTQLFDALVEMMNLDLISFTAEYDMKGHITLFEDKEIEYEDDDKKKKNVQSEQKIYKLSWDEELALKNIDLAKEEIVNIYRFDSGNGNYRYALPPDKETKMNDDRAYCVAMLAWHLQQLRRSTIVNKEREKIDLNTIPSYVSSLEIRL
jgi:hypothetical protein